MGGVFRFVNGGGARLSYTFELAERRAFEFFAYTGMVLVDGVAPCRSIFFVDELSNGNFREVRIAHKFGAVVKSAAERFDFEVDGVGGTVAKFREIEAFENVEDFDQRYSAGRWRRSADDVIPAIGAANGHAF